MVIDYSLCARQTIKRDIWIPSMYNQNYDYFPYFDVLSKAHMYFKLSKCLSRVLTYTCLAL